MRKNFRKSTRQQSSVFNKLTTLEMTLQNSYPHHPHNKYFFIFFLPQWIDFNTPPSNRIINEQRKLYRTNKILWYVDALSFGFFFPCGHCENSNNQKKAVISCKCLLCKQKLIFICLIRWRYTELHTINSRTQTKLIIGINLVIFFHR